MVSISDQKDKKKFKKRDYRAWNLSGDTLSSTCSSKTPIKPMHQPPPNTSTNNIVTNYSEQIEEIEPGQIRNWFLHDRKDFELGDINALAADILANGQQQPIIVRRISDPIHHYEVIAGERRWRACTLAGIAVKAIVNELNDAEAAACQISENSNRQTLSPYSMGMNYQRLIHEKVLKRSDLQKILGKSKSNLDRLLSFSSVPQSVWDAVGDMSKVSPRTAELLRTYCNKGQHYIDRITLLSEKIREGIGARKLERLLNSSDNPTCKTNDQSARSVTSENGRHVFTWKRDSNKNPSITFPKDIRAHVDFDQLEVDIIASIERQLEQLKLSPRGDSLLLISQTNKTDGE